MSKEHLPKCKGCGDEMPLEWRDTEPRDYCDECLKEVGDMI